MGRKTADRKRKKTPAVTKKSPAAGGKTAGRGMKRRSWSLSHCIYFLAGIAFLLTVFIGLTLYLFILLDIPNLKSIRDYEPKLTTLVIARNGQVVKEIFAENRRIVNLDMMPELLPKAFVAAEDARFYEHPGVDIWSIFRALFHNFRSGAKSQGGSTITQQVTRSLLLSRKKLYSRKIKEAILAYRIDSVLSKDDILYIYLNQIYLGEGAYGVEAAARTYFNRKARNLTLAQIALLAGMPQAPSRYSPFKDLKLAKKRQAYVLNRMAEEGYISPEAARAAFAEPLGLETRSVETTENGYFLQQVSNYISNKYGQETLLTGGLTVYTCLDALMQHEAKMAVRKGVRSISGDDETDNPQAAMVVLEEGRVRAVVGGLDFSTSQFDRAIQAKRQPGSAFKPIIYAAALEKGLRPDSLFLDEPLRLPGASRSKTWEPKNFDNRFIGPTTLREGLVHSRNIIAIRLLQKIGIGSAIDLARKLGIQSPLKHDLTLALGSSGVSLLELTAAFGAFADKGNYHKPIFIEKIIDRHGRILEENTANPVMAVSEETAVLMDGMLQEVISRGTGSRARGLRLTGAGKTGTTDNNLDAWFIGYTEKLLVGVWVGHDRNTSLGPKASGGMVAAPIWFDFMKRMEEEAGW